MMPSSKIAQHCLGAVLENPRVRLERTRGVPAKFREITGFARRLRAARARQIAEIHRVLSAL
jgi:hypothetical protein